MAQEQTHYYDACQTLEERVTHTTLQTSSWLEELPTKGERGGGMSARSVSLSGGTAFSAPMSEPAKMSVSETPSAETPPADSESETILNE